MPAKMRANPANSGPVRISPKNSTENVTPNTDSVARNSDAGAGSTCATAKFCSSSAMHEANMAKYPRLTHVSSPKLANAGMGSNASPAPKPRTPATRNCTTVSSVMSRPRAYFAVYSTCRLRKNADSSVIRSPKRSENPESPANETQPTPATHTRAAAMLKRVGRGPRSAHPRNGMITQYSDVRNALFEAVVSVSPVEFAQYERNRNAPRMAPFFRWSRSSAFLNRGNMTMPKMMPATVKRTPTSHAGGNSSTVDLMTTVPNPQMAVATRRKALYIQRGCSLCFTMRAIVQHHSMGAACNCDLAGKHLRPKNTH